jgi:hypothetical protein
MTVAIGPYDGRKTRRKRCDACVKRKIKVTLARNTHCTDSTNAWNSAMAKFHAIGAGT